MVVSSPAVLFLLKFIFRRDRPVNPLVGTVDGFSFPSGHSFFSFSFFGVLAYLIWISRLNRSLRLTLCILSVLIACIIAFSRAYLRLHFASDVVAGFCLSLAWLCMWLWVVTRLSIPAHLKTN
jgi:undecaprenyl-diphosphatase